MLALLGLSFNVLSCLFCMCTIISYILLHTFILCFYILYFECFFLLVFNHCGIFATMLFWALAVVCLLFFKTINQTDINAIYVSWCFKQYKFFSLWTFRHCLVWTVLMHCLISLSITNLSACMCNSVCDVIVHVTALHKWCNVQNFSE